MKKIIQTILISIAMLAVPIIGTSLQTHTVSAASKCGGVDTAILSCGGSEKADKVEDTGIWAILLLVLNLMTGLVGLAAVGGIVYASILYTTAQDNSGQVTKAKETIFNVVLGIVLFALMYSFLQFIIPGGVFN